MPLSIDSISRYTSHRRISFSFYFICLNWSCPCQYNIFHPVCIIPFNTVINSVVVLAEVAISHIENCVEIQLHLISCIHWRLLVPWLNVFCYRFGLKQSFLSGLDSWKLYYACRINIYIYIYARLYLCFYLNSISIPRQEIAVCLHPSHLAIIQNKFCSWFILLKVVHSMPAIKLFKRIQV